MPQHHTPITTEEKEKEIEEGEALAKKLHIEQVDEAISIKLQQEDDKSYADYKKYKKSQEDNDQMQARMLEMEQREDEFIEVSRRGELSIVHESSLRGSHLTRLSLRYLFRVAQRYNRRCKNELDELKGSRALQKAQKQELKSIFTELKAQKLEYKKAKFVPLRVEGGVKLILKIKDVFTSDISVDSQSQKLVCKVESNPPKVPFELSKYIGGDDVRPNKFECDLWLKLNAGGGKYDWNDLDVSKSYDKEKEELQILIIRRKGDNGWLRKTEIFAKYKNGSWFW